MSRRAPAALLLLAAACYVAPEPKRAPVQPQCIDKDGDSYCADIDCNDDDKGVYPGAPDKPGDGVDQNCDGYY